MNPQSTLEALALENRNIASHLPRMANSHPEMRGVVCPHARDYRGRDCYTFKQLDDESNTLAAGLESYGICRGTRTVLMVTPSLDFFALTFALFKIGAVPVMIDPGMGLKNLKQCLQEAQPEAFIGIPKAHVARLLLRWPKVAKLVTVGKKFLWGGTTLEKLRLLGSGHRFEMPVLSDDDQAAILFTSGSTGVPKGAIYTHGIFQTQVSILRRLYQIELGEVDLATFPLFALFAPALGMTAIIPNMDFTRPALVDPEHIIDTVRNQDVTNMFGSPALLNRVARYGVAQGAVMPSLKRVISAGAPVSGQVMGLFSQMLEPGTQIFTPYGATESLPVASMGSDEILSETAPRTALGEGVCVGVPVEELELRIIRISDDPIETYDASLDVPVGEVGEIAVKGPMVTKAYFNRDASTVLAKMKNPGDDAIWHRMGDVGYLDDQGRIWFCGRKAHRVVTKSGTLFSVRCEGIFNSDEDVFRSALVGVPDGQGFQTPVVCIELEQSARSKDVEAIRKRLLKLAHRFPMTRQINHLLFHDAFPVDIRHNAKIFREKLAVWAAEEI